MTKENVARDPSARVSQKPNLASRALGDLRAEFAGYGHRPSADQWAALEALIATFETLSAGSAEPALYLSALDPGVGKTSAVIAYLKQLMLSPDHRHVGVLLCLYRLDEIERLTSALSGPGRTVAVKTSDDDLNALSTADVDNAQVLIITQQRLELLSRGRAFNEARSLFYKGAPRVLRIWDESFLPGRVVTPSSGNVASTLQWLERTHAEASDWMKDLFGRMEDAADGDIVSVPMWDFADDGKRLTVAGRPLHRRARDGDRTADEQNRMLQDLQALGGKSFTVRRNGRFVTRSLAAYRRTLSHDLLPLVVLDASGRVRKTYEDLAETMQLVRLPPATKDYVDLTVRVWNHGGGKSAFDAEKVGKIIDAIGDLIERSDHEGRWLIVSHKKNEEVPDIEALLRRRLTRQANERVDVLTWGNHAAVNDYANTERVILAGTLFYPEAYYEALRRLCLDKGPTELPLNDGELADTKLGESGHLVLQALCRASVRKSDGGKARPCTAYLIASKRSGIRPALRRWFPGCCVESWEPNGPRTPKGNAARVVARVRKWLAEGRPGGVLRFREIYHALNIREDVFRELRQSETLKRALADLGVTEIGGPKLKTGYGLAQ